MHAYTHAHNDYQHERPLGDALATRFHSVEADVWFAGGAFDVSHLGLFSDGTLRELYLDPLQRRVDELGSVHGDGAPFFLWIDLKDDDPKLVRKLEALLAGYSMFSTFGNGAREGAVTAVLTGNDDAKRRYTRELKRRHAVRDSNFFDLSDAPEDGWAFYALPWDDVFSWNGVGEIPDSERRRLLCLVENADALGRGVRLYATPDREEVWRALFDAGASFVQTDRPAALSAFAESL